MTRRHRPRLALRLLACPGALFVVILTFGLFGGLSPAHAQKDGYTDFWDRDYATGDWDGLRDELAAKGITLTLPYTAEVLGNVAGGIKRGAEYDGLFQPQVDVDLDTLLGWHGASFRASMIQGHGPALSNGWTGNIMGESGTVVVPPATRLYNLWLQQKFFGDVLSIRAGMMNVDAEFLTSQTAGLFMNTTFGWPSWTGADLPGGGPAFPLSAPGVRVLVHPGPPGIYMQAAAFSGDPTGHNGSTSSSVPGGTVISFSGGVFVIGEAGYAINQEKNADGAPMAFKLGGWYHTGDQFQDPRYGTDGLSLANPLSNGIPRTHDGDWGLYGVADAVLYQNKDGNALAAFLRAGTSPADRNLVSFYFDSGLTYQGLIPGRGDDTVGIAVAYAQIGSSARGLDQDTQQFTANPGYPIRGEEVVMELSYQVQVATSITVQPDLQYVFNPDGGVLNANGTPRRNAVVIGLRSVISF